MFSQWLNSHRIFKQLAMALIRLRAGAGWSDPLLVAHTTLLEISCRGSYLKLLSLFLQVFKLLQSIKSMNATTAVKPFRESIILNDISLSIVMRGPLYVTFVIKGSMIKILVSWKYHLKRHQLIHSDERPFKCNLCNKGFNDKSSLREHCKSYNHEWTEKR